MPEKEKVERNMAICHLRAIGWSFYSIAKVIYPTRKNVDKRNVTNLYYAHRDKYPLFVKNPENGK